MMGVCTKGLGSNLAPPGAAKQQIRGSLLGAAPQKNLQDPWKSGIGLWVKRRKRECMETPRKSGWIPARRGRKWRKSKLWDFFLSLKKNDNSVVIGGFVGQVLCHPGRIFGIGILGTGPSWEWAPG